VFTRNERLRFFAKIFQTRTGAPLTATLDFVGAAGRVTQSVALPLAGHYAVDVTVSLNALAPGAYRARLTIKDAATATASREVSLVIRP
jgi:hypothetical protein